MTSLHMPMHRLRKTARRLVGCCLLVVLCNVVLAPVANAQTAGPGCNEASTTAFAPVAGQILQLVSCTEEQQGGNNQSLTIDVPTGVQAGDFLVFVLSTDGGNEDIDDPTEYNGDWSLAGTYEPSQGITSEVFYQVADATTPATYTFGWDSNEEYYAYMLRFTGASGLFAIGLNTGNSGTATTPAISTNSLNNLILKMVNVDRRDFASLNDTADVTGMTTPYYNITEDSSSPGGGANPTTSAAALYYYQATQGLGAAGAFNLTSGGDGWHARTMAIEPVEFRISMPDSVSAVCGSQEVTISVTNRLGTPVPFSGTISLSASNATGASWSDAGSLTNAVNDLGNGNATYTFAAGDGGQATFLFQNPNAGTTNFNIAYNSIAQVELLNSSPADPDLTITDNCPSFISQSCVAGSSNTVTIGAQNPDPLQRGRMVLMAIGLEGTSEVTSARFDAGGANIPMTLVYEELNLNGAGNITEIWGILDANLPGAGTYTADFVTADADPAMCLIYLEDTDQIFPTPSSGATGANPVNGSQALNTQNAVTQITTTANNALVISVIGNGSGGADYPVATSVPGVPSITWSKLFDAPDPGGGAEFEASYGFLGTAGALTVTESWSGGNPNRHSHVVASFNPLVPKEFRLSHSGQSDVCSREAITVSVTDPSGNLISGFAGTVTISNSALAGTWSVSDATNGLVDNGNGSVDYTFDPADGGDIVLFFQLPFTDAAVDFEVTALGISSPSGGFDPTLDVAACTVDVQVASPTAGICEAGVTVTYTVLDRFGADAVDFDGTIILSNDTGNGTYTPVGELGDFDDLGSGSATYDYHPDDDGVLTLTFDNDTAETVNLSASAPSITLDGGSDTDITFEECEFRITFVDATPGSTDVCSRETVRIEVVDSVGATVTDYTGTIVLTTSTGHGGWAVSSAEGTVFDSDAFDGTASYTFVDDGPGGAADDDGIIELTFTHPGFGSGSVNFNVTDGTTTDPGNPGSTYDPNLTVALCTFQISYDGGATNDNATKTACDIQQITIGVYRSLGQGGGLATDYTGTVNISTSTDHGNWLDNTNSLPLTDTPGDDDGAAIYTFNGVTDGGEVTFDFINLNTETMTVDLIDEVDGVDGVIEEDGSADPELEITSCLPVVEAVSCDTGASPLQNSIVVNPRNSVAALQGRLVLVATAMDGNGDVSSVTFDGVPMTQIRDERAEAGAYDSNTELWGILDAQIDPAGGNLTAEVIHNDPYNPSMCVFYFEDVEQVLPVEAAPPEDGPLNGDQSISVSVPNTVSSTITTTENNALVVSVSSSGSTGAIGNGDYSAFSPSPPLTETFQGPDSTYFIFGGASGLIPSASTVNVSMTATSNGGYSPDRHTQIVAAFNPLISGPPVAVDFEPVVLFETYSGNISYRAIGNSLRTRDNEFGFGETIEDVCVANTFADANLTLPEVDETLLAGWDDSADPGDDIDSNVIAAYLYWFGSGDVTNPPPGTDFDQVTFTVDPGGAGEVITAITADELFSVQNLLNDDTIDFFAAYKDVTALVTATGSTETYRVSDHPAVFGPNWDGDGVCGGGWSLVVVYENPFEQLRVINLFHGFQPFQNSAFTLVPRNFRMASPLDRGEQPNGQVTHVTLEGDYDLDSSTNNFEESLTIQDMPGSTDPADYFDLPTIFNPSGNEFNGTVTRPHYILEDLGGGEWVYQWDNTYSEDNGTTIQQGYEIDFLGDQSPDSRELGASWGVDIDTHYLSGDPAGDTFNVPPETDDANVLFEFANTAAEEITTRYASGQDMVLLISEVISVMNAPIADLEIELTELDPKYRVHSTGDYQVVVTNNGNGATSFGTATGNLTVTGNLPTGMTFAAPGDVSGTGWDCSTAPQSGVSSNAFTCNYDIAGNIGSLGDASVDPLNFTVQIAGPHLAGTPFPSLNNNAKVIVRLQHNDGTCTPAAIGVMPDPLGCESPEFDNVNDLQGGVIDIDDLDDKTGNNNNVDSITTVVRGIETNLGITKVLQDLLEDDDPNVTADFTITVTNYGPDDIFPSTDPTLPMVAPTIEVNDTEPSFIQFDSVVADAGWTCNPITNPGSTSLNCDFDGTLLVGNSTTITLTTEVTGTNGDLVSNTATVDNGLYNFDPEPETPAVDDPDSDSDGGTIQFATVSATERFLMSVSGAALTTLGSGGGQLSNFEPNDLIIYDPQTDSATMFLDNSAEGFGLNDINAVHLLPNGQIILSTASASTVGDNAFAFQANDLVIYDPITRQGSLLLDGDDPAVVAELGGENIDAVYVLDNGDIIFSTASAVASGIGWSESDLVRWDGAAFSIYLTGDDASVFGASGVNVDAVYLRVDPADATAVLDTFIMSSSEEGGTAGDNLAGFGRDDVVELDVDTTPDPGLSTGTAIFRGNVPFGVFTSSDPARTISALHVIEDGYYGHFSIVQSQAGSACQAGQVTIRKHQVGGGGSHQIDTDYTGSIQISLDSVSDGDWSLAFGNGILSNGTADDGMATYTFVPSDNGQVTLNLDLTETIPVAKSVNVNVTNGFVDELEDPTFNFNLVITDVDYKDNFDAVSYSNNDGSANWANSWQEVDALNGVIGTDPANGFGPSIGNIQINSSRLSLTTNPTTDGAGIDPSVTRDFDLSLYNANQTTYLDFDYSYANLNLADSIVVEVSDDGGSNWVQAANLTSLQNTNGSPTNVNVSLNSLGGALDNFATTLSVRFRVNNGYTLASTMYIHNVTVSTGTTDCTIGAMDHYHIDVATSGIACVANTVTIMGHDANHLPAEPGAGVVMNFTTSTGAGTWSDLVMGGGVLVDIGGPGTNTDGIGSYTWAAGESSVTLLFNYTDPATDTPLVNIDISGTYEEIEDDDFPADANDHDPSITFAEAGLRFFDENTLNPAITTLPFQIAGKPSLTLPTTGDVTVQMIRSVPLGGENPSLACESLVPADSIVTIKLAGLCENPGSCSAPAPDITVWDQGNNPIAVPIFSSPTANPEQSGVDVDLFFESQPTLDEGQNNIGASLNFMYPDAGQISLHGEFEIPLGNDLAGVLSGDTLRGASQPFVVRPFGLDIDFSGDRAGGGTNSFATDENGPAFARAGVPFDTTIRGVQWQAGDDDLDNDGLPDSDADLSDNDLTPNFGNESGTDDYAAQITVDTTNPGVPGGVTGAITTGFGLIDNINNGVSGAAQSLAINEVGIFDLDAELVDDAVSPAVIGYLGATDTNGVSAGITGRVVGVGRIYPNNFTVTSSSFGPRVNQSMSCSPTSPFTYLGEDFGLNMVIQAKNAQDEDTVNYIGDFAKLTAFTELNMRAIIDVGGAADNDLGSKLVNSTIAANFSGSWVAGELTISGDMRIARQPSGAEEAPLENVQIVFGPIDDNDDGVGGGNDVILDVLDVDLDDGMNEDTDFTFKLISTHEFRYGRLIVENAFGPETEDLGIPLRIEYFDGTNFVTNIADSCTSFVYDVDGSPALTFVPGSYLDDLDPGETVIENGELVDVEINLYEGVTNRQQDGDTDDDNDTDRPFITSAPDPEGDDEFSGQALVEFDLSAGTLSTSLDFLSYDWRGDAAEDPMDPYDEIPDGDYGDLPRGIIEFGSYRGHDRVINWQELFITN
jgi:hypothetical protein